MAVHGRDDVAMGVTRRRSEEAGGRAIAVAAAVTRYDEIEAMRARVEGELGPSDILVANPWSVETRATPSCACG